MAMVVGQSLLQGDAVHAMQPKLADYAAPARAERRLKKRFGSIKELGGHLQSFREFSDRLLHHRIWINQENRGDVIHEISIFDKGEGHFTRRTLGASR